MWSFLTVVAILVFIMLILIAYSIKKIIKTTIVMLLLGSLTIGLVYAYKSPTGIKKTYSVEEVRSTQDINDKTVSKLHEQKTLWDSKLNKLEEIEVIYNK